MEENVSQATVKSVSIKWGLINTVVSIVVFLIPILIGQNPFAEKMWGWIGMGVGVVLLVLAHKDFKDNGNGYMSYGQGFGIAFWSGLIATMIPGMFSYIYAEIIDPSVMEGFYQVQRETMEAAGNMPDNQVDIAIEWTQKLFWPMYLVIAIVGTIFVGLIVTIFTQKRNPQPNY